MKTKDLILGLTLALSTTPAFAADQSARRAPQLPSACINVLDRVVGAAEGDGYESENEVRRPNGKLEIKNLRAKDLGHCAGGADDCENIDYTGTVIDQDSLTGTFHLSLGRAGCVVNTVNLKVTQ